MTDTPGWTPPGPSAEPDASAPAAPAATPAPQGTTPPPAAPGPYGGGYGSWGTGPAAPGPQPGGPYGPQFGGPYGWGAPPSPKPGVVPLRPLGVGEILDGAFSTARIHWRTCFGLSIVLAAITEVVQALAEWWGYRSGSATTYAFASYAVLPLDLLVGVIAGGLLTIVVSRAVLGQPTDLKDAWRSTRPRLGQLLGLTGLQALIMGGLFALLLGAGSTDLFGPALPLLMLPILAVIIWVVVSIGFAAPALMLEKQDVITALKRSWRLVHGAWWRIFGINVLLQLLLFLIAAIAVLPFAALAYAFGAGFGDPFAAESDTAAGIGIALLAVGGTVVKCITIPAAAACTVLLYVDQRIRREALDIELARAAGLPGHGAPHATVPGQTTPPGA
ncbi:hypothetical protein [Kitasatospora terrestris]|uniref:DUF7847 domain-containing protein n=1 Tax=Kitasatospora terrestris TaxID=258051 RepID=A0ABP9DMJ2_9ACTN